MFICLIIWYVLKLIWGDNLNYLDNIKELIEKDIVLKKKHRLIENNSTLNTYFEIGRLIIEAQGGEDRAKYGNDLINTWSKTLTNEYGKEFTTFLFLWVYSKMLSIEVDKKYNPRTLRRMRQLYLTFQKRAPVGHISWTHYKYILPIKLEAATLPNLYDLSKYS